MPLQNVVYFITLPFLVRKIFTFYIHNVLLFKCPFPGPKGSIQLTFLTPRVYSLTLFNFLDFRMAQIFGK